MGWQWDMWYAQRHKRTFLGIFGIVHKSCTLATTCTLPSACRETLHVEFRKVFDRWFRQVPAWPSLFDGPVEPQNQSQVLFLGASGDEVDATDPDEFHRVSISFQPIIVGYACCGCCLEDPRTVPLWKTGDHLRRHVDLIRWPWMVGFSGCLADNLSTLSQVWVCHSIAKPVKLKQTIQNLTRCLRKPLAI